VAYVKYLIIYPCPILKIFLRLVDGMKFVMIKNSSNSQLGACNVNLIVSYEFGILFFRLLPLLIKCFLNCNVNLIVRLHSIVQIMCICLFALLIYLFS
jgi:hypothetical protein